MHAYGITAIHFSEVENVVCFVAMVTGGQLLPSLCEGSSCFDKRGKPGEPRSAQRFTLSRSIPFNQDHLQDQGW